MTKRIGLGVGVGLGVVTLVLLLLAVHSYRTTVHDSGRVMGGRIHVSCGSVRHPVTQPRVDVIYHDPMPTPNLEVAWAGGHDCAWQLSRQRRHVAGWLVAALIAALGCVTALVVTRRGTGRPESLPA